MSQVPNWLILPCQWHPSFAFICVPLFSLSIFYMCPKSCLSTGCWIKFQVRLANGLASACWEVKYSHKYQSRHQLDTNHKDHQIKYLPPQKFHISPPRGILPRSFMCADTPVNIRKLPREVPRRLSQMPVNK